MVSSGSRGSSQSGLPFSQIHSMFRERIKALVVQHKASVRTLWRSFGDPRDLGIITAKQFHAAVNQLLDVALDRPDCDRLLKTFSDRGDQISFHDFFHGLCALPIDYFSADMAKTHRANGPDSKSLLKQDEPLLPRSTTTDSLDARFRCKCRESLFDIRAALARVLRRPASGIEARLMDKNHLFNIVAECDLHLQSHVLDALFNTFDHNRDGFIEYEELVRELLQLSAPRATRRFRKARAGGSGHVTPSMNGSPVVKMLQRNCERAAAPPAKIMTFFKRYDGDGSGKIAYDEMRMMVRDTNCQLEGKDAASVLMDRYSHGKGTLTYMDFIERVLRLPRESLRDSPTRPATAEMVGQVLESMKSKVMAFPAAQQRAFDVFRQDRATIRAPEFCNRVMALGLPVNPKASRKLFANYDTDQSGEITKQQFMQTFLTPKGPRSSTPGGLSARTKSGGMRSGIPGGTPRMLPPRTQSQMSSRTRLDTHRNTF